MTPEAVIELGREALWTMLMVSLPMLGAGLLVGLFISILQAATQVNEMTMTFVPKIIAVLLVMVLLLPWILSNLTTFTHGIFERIGGIGAT